MISTLKWLLCNSHRSFTSTVCPQGQLQRNTVKFRHMSLCRKRYKQILFCDIMGWFGLHSSTWTLHFRQCDIGVHLATKQINCPSWWHGDIKPAIGNKEEQRNHFMLWLQAGRGAQQWGRWSGFDPDLHSLSLSIVFPVLVKTYMMTSHTGVFASQIYQWQL